MTNEEFQESLIWALKTLLAASYVNIFCPTSRGSADLGPAPDASVLAVSGEKGRLFDLFWLWKKMWISGHILGIFRGFWGSCDIRLATLKVENLKLRSICEQDSQ